jgi:hypothetical protein
MKQTTAAGLAAALAAICTLTISGCASTPAPAPARPAPAATPALSGMFQRDLPIEAYEFTWLQSAQEDYLEQHLRQLCMKRFGFDYLPELSTAMIPLGTRIAQEIESRRYGVSDPDAVRTYGYRLPAWTEGTAPPLTFADLPTAERSVLLGTATTYHGQPVPENGCLAQAAHDLQDSGISTVTQQSGGRDPSELAAQIRSADFQRTQSDPRVLAVSARWSACMRTYGYSYSTPFAAAGDPRWPQNGPVSAAEITAAEHDLACKQQVNLLGVEFAIESDYENVDIASHSQAMSAVKTQVESEAAALQHAMADA